jgi:hypothetical protein
MNCPQCGKRIWSDDRYCKNCGLNLQSSPSQAVATSVAEDAPLKGVGGWLLFFCILRTIFGPLSIYYPRHFGPSIPIAILVLLQAAFGIVVGIHVWSVSKSAFLLLRIYFGSALLVQALQLFLSLVTLLASPSQSEFDTAAGLVAGFIGIALTIAWIGYFRYSDRVRATFGSNLTFPF